jgi:hypothetical protein
MQRKIRAVMINMSRAMGHRSLGVYTHRRVVQMSEFVAVTLPIIFINTPNENQILPSGECPRVLQKTIVSSNQR